MSDPCDLLERGRLGTAGQKRYGARPPNGQIVFPGRNPCVGVGAMLYAPRFPKRHTDPVIMFTARIDNNRRRRIVREIADATVFGSRAGARGHGGH